MIFPADLCSVICRYLLAQAFGGIIVSPFSESFGRRTLYIYACIIFCAFNVLVGASHSFVAVFFGRFFTGFVASIPATVAFGSFEDMYDARWRIWVVYIYTTFGNVGLVLGPIYAAYISRAIGWRWIFYSRSYHSHAFTDISLQLAVAAIASFLSVILARMMNETRAISLLAHKVRAIKQDTGFDDLHTVSTGRRITPKVFLTDGVYRPLFFLVTEPLVTCCAILCSIAFALFYAETETLTLVYTSPRLSPSPFNMTNSSLSFIAVLLGLLLDVIPRFWDQHVYTRAARNATPLKPEAKIGGFAVACPVLAIGLWIFAWTIPPYVTNVHWVVSMIGLVFIGFAANDFAVVLFGYITDSYGPYAASAVSTLSLTRTVVAAVFPLFTTQMYTGLGANLATTVFAAIATVFAFTPLLFLMHGAELRRKSSWAVTTDADKKDEGDAESSEKNDDVELGSGARSST